MNLLGGAWTPHILWYLKANPRRFSELKDDIDGVSAKVLTQRLKELAEMGLVNRTVVPSSPPSVEYSLTELGRELMPAIEAIADVGYKLQERGIQL
ncbi:DNA-binding HxlR family transcriptional regulator [Neorhizobium galegae]|uniref:winged helix-turn-helix transcriptional regulator n=1 Tax=Neorhizobium galegae TaxID=399 RepID=UPI001ECBC88A|nr:helix-turn-helix domain-containing protein [Neorhizobium galegae]MBP2562561.1 DNA-binding HxlR family transcriptional regulator [Neorhizobium galegae]